MAFIQTTKFLEDVGYSEVEFASAFKNAIEKEVTYLISGNDITLSTFGTLVNGYFVEFVGNETYTITNNNAIKYIEVAFDTTTKTANINVVTSPSTETATLKYNIVLELVNSTTSEFTIIKNKGKVKNNLRTNSITLYKTLTQGISANVETKVQFQGVQGYDAVNDPIFNLDLANNRVILKRKTKSVLVTGQLRTTGASVASFNYYTRKNGTVYKPNSLINQNAVSFSQVITDLKTNDFLEIYVYLTTAATLAGVDVNFDYITFTAFYEEA